MRILIYGAGAIGSYLGGILTLAGAEVELLARGAQHRALSAHGLTLDGLTLNGTKGDIAQANVNVVDADGARGPYDVIIVCLKSHQIAAAAEHIGRLVAQDGMLVMLQNGLPWWYFEKSKSPRSLNKIDVLDPDGTLARALPADRLIGGVIYKSAEVIRPGYVRLASLAANRLVVGELDGTRSERLERLAALFTHTELRIDITDDIRAAKWRKLMQNIAFGSVAALTQSKAAQIAAHAPAADVVTALMEETLAVAAAVGVKVDAVPRDLIETAKLRSEHPPSLLQDTRAGRPLEIDAVVMSVLEIGRKLAVPTPTLQTVSTCLALLNRRIVEDGWSFTPVEK